MQGTAAAYDLCRFGDASQVTLLDGDAGRAEAAVARLVGLGCDQAVAGRAVDVRDPEALAAALKGSDATISAVPYFLHVPVHEAALAAGSHSVDMGCDTPDALALQARGAEWALAGRSAVTDSGLAPGLINTLGRAVRERVEAREVRLYCGGLPQHPKPPFHYALRFSADGLIGEYQDEAVAVLEGRLAYPPPLEDLENLEIDGVAYEAATTSGGTGTAPYRLEGKLDTYAYKTLRYPGHFGLMRGIRDFGLWQDDEVEVEGAYVSPRKLFVRLAERALIRPDEPDVVVTRAVGVGTSTLTLDVVERFDPATGFFAMERLTGFTTAIVAAALAAGEVAPGVHAHEDALSPEILLERLGRREIAVVVG